MFLSRLKEEIEAQIYAQRKLTMFRIWMWVFYKRMGNVDYDFSGRYDRWSLFKHLLEIAAHSVRNYYLESKSLLRSSATVAESLLRSILTTKTECKTRQNTPED